MMQAQHPPAGFRDPEVGGFVGQLGPIYRKDGEGSVASGFTVEQRHCNPADICHGGWLSTFADVAMVRVAGAAGGRWVTTNLTVDFHRSARLGEWVESDCSASHRSNRTCVVHGLALVDGIAIMRMNATYRRID